MPSASPQAVVEFGRNEEIGVERRWALLTTAHLMNDRSSW